MSIPHLVFADDSFDDLFFIKRAIERLKMDVRTEFFTHGGALVDFLKGVSTEEYVAVLDVKMPFIDGFELLSMIRRDPKLTDLRVVILTTSVLPRDIETARALGANAYFQKPQSGSQYEAMINGIIESFADHLSPFAGSLNLLGQRPASAELAFRG